MPSLIQVGGLSYTRFSLEREIRFLLHNSPLGVELDEVSFRFMSDVLKLHPRAAGKIGCGLRSIRVVASRYGNRCFEVVRTDESTEPFSIATCLGKKKRKAPEEPPPYHENPDFERQFLGD